MRGQLRNGDGGGDDTEELDQALAAFGLQREGPPPRAADAEFHLWPEHLDALRLWIGVQTQWRHGFDGPTGLDYAGVRASPAFRRLATIDRDRVFDELCVMERAALDALRADRARR